ncbi:MAG TPA: DUF58 domain-containing protein [Fimbriimonadaceae bacterium]|nr:DUF58 domain-containing protein [Fimbriimonadaceae bacterium]
MARLVLTPSEFRILEGLRLNPRKSFSGRVRGERLTRKKGVSIDFDDYREYSDGDDLRHLDWNVLARLEHAVVKTYRDEEDLAVHLLVDTSASMSFGEPSKLDYAVRLACAIGYVALAGGDAVYARTLGARSRPMAAMRGRGSYPRLARWADDLKPEGEFALAREIRSFAISGARPGLAVIVSDGMDPEVFNAVRVLGGRGHEVTFLQVLSEVELRPDLEGDLRLLDVEDKSSVEVTANSMTMREYAQRLEAHNQRLVEECTRMGGRCSLVEVGTPLDKVVRDVLRRGGWVAA